MRSFDRYPPRYPWTAYLWPLLLLLALATVLTWRFWPQTPWAGLDPNAVPRAVTPRGDLAEDEKTTIAIFRQASPSVVHITTLDVRQDAFSLDLFQIPRGTGSGFVWDQDGHVVTNFHVIQGADAARVTLADQSSWSARLVGSYPDKDLAVLVIDAPRDRLRPIPVGTSHDLQVGQKVFAIGNPFGLDQSLTTGVISALGREIESVTRRPIKDMIQTDTAINPGNSGGPLLDSAGRLIGVNTAIFSPSGAYAGIGFAIPVDEVNRVVPQLIRHGKVTRPGLGVQVAPDQLARQLGLQGVLIFEVQPDGPAAQAGLRPTRRDANNRLQLGDVIVALDGRPVRSVNELLDVLEQHQVGDTVPLKILRDGEERQVSVSLAAVR
jgi:S1-C subfamily serine protease